MCLGGISAKSRHILVPSLAFSFLFLASLCDNRLLRSRPRIKQDQEACTLREALKLSPSPHYDVHLSNIEFLIIIETQLRLG
ncbi:hypothetical protein BO99DRAFT_401847 [Aspergillus violaceofuscus CBS 115571]|uniref:Uncharacterized protein n=1 Tax=Aspergillus violaceofuscus (strain CBS 115571) TaxID=1450538 RepID=A0A2V5H829_ASPV1|nr:hypothetical protein BO99DRAFT_401847 [Aspergillus violaceofuscus CBS 115571]